MFQLKNLKIFNFITIITVIMFSLASAMLITTTNFVLKKHAYTDAFQKSQIVLDMGLSVHNFYSQELIPGLLANFKKIGNEQPEDLLWTSSSHAVKEINKFFNSMKPENMDFYYREISMDTTSFENEADSYEKDFLSQLGADNNINEKIEIRYFDKLPFLTILKRFDKATEPYFQESINQAVFLKNKAEENEPFGNFKTADKKGVGAISIRFPLADDYRKANQISLGLGLVLLLLLGIFVTIQILINRQLLFRPLSLISKAATEIAGDNSRLGKQIHGNFGKETASLASSFNTMSLSLREGRDNLEEKIKKRSAELTKINDLLAEDIIRRKEIEKQLKLERLKAEHANQDLEREIEERKKVEKYIRSLAYHDNLTGLPNRILFYDRTGIAIADARRNNKKFAILLFDVDNFKKINDSMGHDRGDDLLRCIAKTLNETLRESDTSARLGGDEFIILLNDIKDEKDAFKVALKISDPLKIINKNNKDCDFLITVSIGISIFPEDGEDITALIKNADIAMYDVKRRGKAFYKRFSAKMMKDVIS